MQSVAQFNGSIPAVYDQELGPFLFDWSAKALGERVRAPVGGLVLELAELFGAAGARDVETESVDHVVELPSARGPAKGLVCGSPAVLELEAREGVLLDAVVDAAEAAIAGRCGASPCRAPLRAIFVSAQK